MISPPSSDGASSAGQRSPLVRTRRLRRRSAVAYAVSALLHVVFLALYPRLFGGLPEARLPGASAAPTTIQGIEVLNLVETTTEVAEVAPEPEPESERMPVPVPPRVQAPPAEVDAAGEGAAADRDAEGLSAAERLQPSTRDGRLWEPIPDHITALSPEQRIENLLYGRLQALNDSSALAAAEAARATDWTYTDGEGNRWGVSPGKLHLGPVTLPLPFSFGLPAGASDVMRRAWEQEAEIRRAAGQAGTDQSLEERNEAIRKRAEERRKARPDTSGVGRR